MPQINEEYRQLDRSPAALRKFGLTIGTALFLLGILLVWRGRIAGWPVVAIAGGIVWLALAAPGRLKILHRIWMTFALGMSWAMTNVILTLVFFLVLTPIGLLQRVFEKRALDLSFKTGGHSYWETRERRQPEASAYERQF